MMEVCKLLKQHQFSDIAIAAILSNIDVQTGGTFEYTTKQRGGNGYGLFQFDYLKDYYNSYLTENKMADSAKAQVEFMVSTLKGSNKDIIGAGNAKEIMAALNGNNLDNATRVFC